MKYKYDSSYVMKNTFCCKNYEFKYENNNLYLGVDLKTNSEENNELKISKKDIFIKIFKLGKYLNDNIDIISVSDNFISFIENNEKIIDEDFFNIANSIYKSKEIQQRIIDFFDDLGIPEWNGLSKPYDYNKYDIDNNKDIFPIITCGNAQKEMFYFYSFYSPHYSFNILPYLNSAILIFYIYNIKNVISNVKTKQLFNSIKLFPYLVNKYETMCFQEVETKVSDIYGNILKKKKFIYNKEFINEVNKYTKLIYFKTIRFINYKININNKEEIVFDDFNIPYNEYDKNPVDFNFITKQYIMYNPFLTAIEYLGMTLSTYQIFPPIYFCDNCGEILDYKSMLCISCKKDIVDEIEIKFKQNNNEKTKNLYKKLKEEYDSVKNDKYFETKNINKIYRERINSKKYYESKGKNLKKEKYKKISNQ